MVLREKMHLLQEECLWGEQVRRTDAAIEKDARIHVSVSSRNQMHCQHRQPLGKLVEQSNFQCTSQRISK